MTETIDSQMSPRNTAPLLPEAGAAGTPLTVVVAVLAFMASISLAGYFMVSRATADWTGDLQGTITVQVKSGDMAEIDRQAEAALRVLSNTPGVLRAERLSREETGALLEPWLGKNNLAADIPIPALITADVTPRLRRDLGPLQQALEVTAPRATLDDHGVWNDRLVDAARRGQMAAFFVFMMVMSASGAVIIFATRAGLAANRSIVEILHLVGATDRFIADEVQRRYLALGLRGGTIGAVAAALLLFALASFQGDESGFFLPNLSADPVMLLWLITVPLILCGVAALTARLTVLQTLAGKLEP